MKEIKLLSGILFFCIFMIGTAAGEESRIQQRSGQFRFDNQMRPIPADKVTNNPNVLPGVSGSGVMSSPKQTQGQTPEVDKLERHLKEVPNDHDGWVRLGDLYFDTSGYSEAISAYTKALDIKPDDPSVICDRAIMYRRLGASKLAASELQRASELDASFMNAFINLGVVLLYDLKDNPGARQAFSRYLELNPPEELAQKVRDELKGLEDLSAK